MAWKHIMTAPKDGTQICAAEKTANGWRFSFAKWSVDEGCWMDAESYAYITPIRWQDVPELHERVAAR